MSLIPHKNGPIAGFSLIEVMITLLILSVGLLSLGLLQAVTLRNNQSTYWRSQASALGSDLMERLRANRATALNGGYNIPYGVTPTALVDCDTAACTADQLATYDLAEWKSSLATLLPSGNGEVVEVVNAGTERIFQISVRWDDDRRNDVLNYKTFSLRGQL